MKNNLIGITMQRKNNFLNYSGVYIFNMRVAIFMIILSFLCAYFNFKQELDVAGLIVGIMISIFYFFPCVIGAVSAYKKLKELSTNLYANKKTKKVLLLQKMKALRYIVEINIVASIILVLMSVWAWYYQHNVVYKIVWIFFVINLIYIVIDLFKIKLYRKKIVLLSSL